MQLQERMIQMRKSEAVEKWIEKWGAGLDWEAKAELRKAVEKAIEEVQNPMTAMRTRKEEKK